MIVDEIKRFLDKTIPEPNTGCLLWLGYTFPKKMNYGQFGFRNKVMLAHRVSYILFKGDIPPGLHVMHKCDTPSCVNPEHLKLGTQLENNREIFLKGRNRNGSENQTHCKWGHPLFGDNMVQDKKQRRCKACCRRKYYERKEKLKCQK